jgi:hypothetical protein
MATALRVATALFLGTALAAWAGPAAQAAPEEDEASKADADKAGKDVKVDAEKAEKAVNDRLKALKGSHAKVELLKGKALGRALPGYAFYFVMFPQFPVARITPAGLKASNVLACDADGKVQVLSDYVALEKFFRAALPALKSDDKLKDAVRAWLSLSQQLKQDGFYTFERVEEATRVEKDDEGKTATGRIVVMKGGSGTMTATLTFDSAGKLTKISQDPKIKPGPRPRCHATKLLDPDPVIRAIVEQDLLIMGRAAKPYLDEQRATASPALRKAIDRIWQRILEREE